jgi:hypothetical protein
MGKPIILNIFCSFRAENYYTYHFPVAEKFREKLAVNKERLHIFCMDRLNLKKFNKVYGKQYHVEVSNRFATLDNLDAEVKINSA